jgi:hypothetical protein
MSFLNLHETGMWMYGKPPSLKITHSAKQRPGFSEDGFHFGGIRDSSPKFVRCELIVIIVYTYPISHSQWARLLDFGRDPGHREANADTDSFTCSSPRGIVDGNVADDIRWVGRLEKVRVL